MERERAEAAPEDGTERLAAAAAAPHALLRLQESLTIPMSRLEDSGVAKDVGLLVKFTRHRADSPREFRNPAIDG